MGRSGLLTVTLSPQGRRQLTLQTLDDSLMSRLDAELRDIKVILPDPLPVNTRQAGARHIPMPAAAEPWRVEADPASPESDRLAAQPMVIASMHPQMSYLQTLAPTGRRVMFTPQPANLRQVEHLTPIVLDIATGQTLETAMRLPPQARPMALSPAGDRVLVLTEARLDVFELPSGAHQAGFELTDSQGRPIEPGRLQAGALIDSDHLLIQTDQEVLAWRLSDATLQWSILTQSAPMQFSPGLRYMLLSNQNHPFIAQVSDGKIAGYLPGSNPGASVCFAFAQDGRRLLQMRQESQVNTLCFIDLTTGRVMRQRIVTRHTPGPMKLLSDEYLLSTPYLIDLESGQAVWEYKLPGLLIDQQVNSRIWYCTPAQGRNAMLRSTILPDDRAMRKIMVAPTAGRNFLGPGSRLAIEARLSEDSLKRFLARLADHQIELADSAPLRLVGEFTSRHDRTAQFKLGSIMSHATDVDPTLADRVVDIQMTTTLKTLKLIDDQGHIYWTTTSTASTMTTTPQTFTLDTPVDAIQRALDAQQSTIRSSDFSMEIERMPMSLHPDLASTLLGSSAVAAE